MISEKRLEAAFPGKGSEIRDLLIGNKGPNDYESVSSWVSKCYNPPSYQEKLEVALNEVLGGYGAEALWGRRVTVPAAVYVNMGDTYITTLLFDYEKDTWYLTSWGDWIERNGKRYGIE